MIGQIGFAIGNQGNYKTYRAERPVHNTVVESQRRRLIAVRGPGNLGLTPAGARALADALLRAADNAQGRKSADPKGN